jgi:hypothetical protein
VLAMVALCLAVAGLWAVQPDFLADADQLPGGHGGALRGCDGTIGNFVSPNVKAWADAHFGSSVMLIGVVVLRDAVVKRFKTGTALR